MFLEGKRHALMESLEARMTEASDTERYEQAAAYRDLLRTLSEIEERQKIAATEGDDIDVLAWHAEPPLVAVNLFHLRGGRVVDRRDFYWEDMEEFEPAEFLSSLLKQLYLDAAYLPRSIHVPMDFEDREILEETADRTRLASGAAAQPRGNPDAAARREACLPGTGGEKRATFV